MEEQLALGCSVLPVARNIHGQSEHLPSALHMEFLLSLEVSLCTNPDSWLKTAETNSGYLKQNENLLEERWVELALKLKPQSWKRGINKERPGKRKQPRSHGRKSLPGCSL